MKMLEGHESQCFVRRGRAHVGQLFLPDGVDVEVVVFRVFSDDHAFIKLNTRTAEKLSPFLQTPESIGSGETVAVGNQGTRETVRNVALPFDVTVEQSIHDDGPARVREQLTAKSNQAAAGNAKLDSHPAVAMIVHVDHGALASAQLLHDNADEFLGNVDGQHFHRLHQFAVDPLGHDFGLAYHQLKALAAHHFQQNRELQLAAA